MSVNRIILSIAGLFSFLALPTDCGQQKPEVYKLTIPCTYSINDTPTGVSVPDAYVCPKTSVTWVAQQGTKEFVVFFNHDCPFSSCKKIDQDHATWAIKDLEGLTVFDYEIWIDGKVFDPHIIGGGH